MVDYRKTPNQRRGQEKEIFEDAFGRTHMSKILVEDTTGKSAMIVNTNVDVQVPFDDKIVSSDLEVLHIRRISASGFPMMLGRGASRHCNVRFFCRILFHHCKHG